MGGKGGGGGGGTTKQVSEPWDAQKSYLKEIFAESKNLYNSGQLAPDYYAGNTVAPQSQWTQNALQMQADRAMAGDAGVNSAQNAMTNITSGGAMAGNTGLSTLEQLAGQNFNAGNAGLDMTLAAGNAAMNNGGLSTLEQLAGQDVNAGNAGLSALEQMTNAVNPYSSALLNDAMGQAGAQIDSGFSGAGRYGSGAHENAKADAMADLSSKFYADAYDKQMQAANAASQSYLSGSGLNASNAAQLGNLYNSALQTQLGAGQAAGNLYNAGSGLQLDAAQNAGQLYNTGIGQQVVAGQTAQQLANQAYTDSAALSEAGGVLDDYQQQLINADIDRYNYDAQKALTALSNYNQLIQGSYGGTTTSTGQQGSGSTLGNVIGGAGLGYGAATMMGLSNPWTAGLAIGGGLLGLL